MVSWLSSTSTSGHGNLTIFNLYLVMVSCLSLLMNLGFGFWHLTHMTHLMHYDVRYKSDTPWHTWCTKTWETNLTHMTHLDTPWHKWDTHTPRHTWHMQNIHTFCIVNVHTSWIHNVHTLLVFWFWCLGLDINNTHAVPERHFWYLGLVPDSNFWLSGTRYK